MRKLLAIAPLLLALASFGASLALTVSPAHAQKIASGAFDAGSGKCTCPDWDGCTCKTLF